MGEEDYLENISRENAETPDALHSASTRTLRQSARLLRAWGHGNHQGLDELIPRPTTQTPHVGTNHHSTHHHVGTGFPSIIRIAS
jgi:hypothetical protein